MQLAHRTAQFLNTKPFHVTKKVMLSFTEQLGQARMLTGTASSGRVGADPGLFGHISIGQVFPLQLYCCITAKNCSWVQQHCFGARHISNVLY